MCEKKLRANKRTVFFINLKAVVQRSSLKKIFLEILQIYREAPVPESLF